MFSTIFREVEERAGVAVAVAGGARGRRRERLRGVPVELRADDGGGEANVYLMGIPSNTSR